MKKVQKKIPSMLAVTEPDGKISVVGRRQGNVGFYSNSP